jgi:hypothetical protein
MKKRSLSLIVVGVLQALAIGAPPAHAAAIDIVWDAQGRYQRKDSVAPGKFVEVCAKLPRGQAVTWAFEADRALDFNVHYHVDKAVLFVTQLDAVARGGDTLRVQAEQAHCWMWGNKGAAPALLDLRLSRP